MKQNRISKFLYKNIRWILLVIALLIFSILAMTVLNQGEFSFDRHAFTWLRNWESPSLTTFFKMVTALASAPVLIVFCLFLLILMKKRTYFYLVGINLINTVVLNTALKFIFRRERPLNVAIIEETGYSFPSGHSMASLAFYGFLIYLLYKSSIKKKLKIALITVLVIIILLIGASRIYLGVHYLSDVLAGFSFTLAYLIIFTKLITNYMKEK